jgi:hypothetical protein
LSWPGASQLFAQLARATARRADDPRLRFEAEAHDGELWLRATAVDDAGRFDSFRVLDARVGGPDGFESTVALEPAGAGRYEARVALSRFGAYVASLVDRKENQVVATSGAVLRRGDEMRPTGSDRNALQRISKLSGGTHRQTLAGIYADRPNARRRFDSLSPLFQLLTAALFFASIAARRAALPDAVSSGAARILARVRRIKTPRLRRSGPPRRQSATADTLVAAKLARRRGEPPHSEGDPLHVPAPMRRPRTSKTAAEPSKQPTAAEILLARRRQRK